MNKPKASGAPMSHVERAARTGRVRVEVYLSAAAVAALDRMGPNRTAAIGKRSRWAADEQRERRAELEISAQRRRSPPPDVKKSIHQLSGQRKDYFDPDPNLPSVAVLDDEVFGDELGENPATTVIDPRRRRANPAWASHWSAGRGEAA